MGELEEAENAEYLCCGRKPQKEFCQMDKQHNGVSFLMDHVYRELNFFVKEEHLIKGVETKVVNLPLMVNTRMPLICIKGNGVHREW